VALFRVTIRNKKSKPRESKCTMWFSRQIEQTKETREMLETTCLHMVSSSWPSRTEFCDVELNKMLCL